MKIYTYFKLATDNICNYFFYILHLNISVYRFFNVFKHKQTLEQKKIKLVNSFINICIAKKVGRGATNVPNTHPQ